MEVNHESRQYITTYLCYFIVRCILDKKLLERVDKMLADDIAKLMAMVPLEEQISKNEGNDRYLHFLPIKLAVLFRHVPDGRPFCRLSGIRKNQEQAVHGFWIPTL